MFNPSRADARRMFFDAWRKHRERLPLVGMEAIVVNVMLEHPEYHALLDDPEQHMERDYSPELGVTNPFLHMSLHLAIEEQLSIGQPPGIKAGYQRILNKCGSPHDAHHVVMECLAETIWQAQRHNAPPDGVAYLACLDRHR
jgi:hypothetical protein